MTRRTHECEAFSVCVFAFDMTFVFVWVRVCGRRMPNVEAPLCRHLCALLNEDEAIIHMLCMCYSFKDDTGAAIGLVLQRPNQAVQQSSAAAVPGQKGAGRAVQIWEQTRWVYLRLITAYKKDLRTMGQSV